MKCLLSMLLWCGAMVSPVSASGIIGAVEFSDGSSAFNNTHELIRLTEHEDKLLFVFHMNYLQGGLADKRSLALSKALGRDEDISIGYRVSQRPMEHNTVLIYGFSNNSELSNFMNDDENNVYDIAVGGGFNESRLRNWRSDIDERNFALHDRHLAHEQGEALASLLGWSLIDVDQSFSITSDYAHSLRVDFISIVNDAVTKSEAEDVMVQWLAQYPALAARFEMSFVDKNLQVLVKEKPLEVH